MKVPNALFFVTKEQNLKKYFFHYKKKKKRSAMAFKGSLWNQWSTIMPVNLCIATLGRIDEAYQIVLICVGVDKFDLCEDS